jgi:hypothetical protein
MIIIGKIQRLSEGLDMHIRSVEEIAAEIKEHYDQEPRGWKLLRGRDSEGHYDTYIANREHLWQMKTEFRNPYRPTGIGVKVMNNPGEDIDLLLSIGESLPFGEIYPQKGSHPIFAMGIGRYSPRAAGELKAIISLKNERLERNLKDGLNRFLLREGVCTDYL